MLADEAAFKQQVADDAATSKARVERRQQVQNRVNHERNQNAQRKLDKIAGREWDSTKADSPTTSRGPPPTRFVHNSVSFHPPFTLHAPLLMVGLLRTPLSLPKEIGNLPVSSKTHVPTGRTRPSSPANPKTVRPSLRAKQAISSQTPAKKWKEAIHLLQTTTLRHLVRVIRGVVVEVEGVVVVVVVVVAHEHALERLQTRQTTKPLVRQNIEMIAT